MTINLHNDNCLYGGCERWIRATKAGLSFDRCERCGFDKEEDQRRKKIPLTLCHDGLQRKIIPKKPFPAESAFLDKEVGE